MRHNLIVTLIALFLPLCFCMGQESGLVVDSFEEIPTDMDARVNYPVLDQNGKRCAIIKVENVNKGFNFSVGTLGVQKVDEHKGETWVYVPAGVNKITISHPQLGILENYELPISIRESTVYLLKLLSDIVNVDVEKGVAKMSFLVINSEPQGAEVFIDGVNVGVTPFSDQYEVGKKVNWTLKKRFYHEKSGAYEIGETKSDSTVFLNPAFGSVMVNSDPAGATVYFDNEVKARGVTPCEINMVPSGGHTIYLELAQYAMSSVDVVVEDGAKAFVDAVLTPTFAEICITSVQDAEISINGSKVGTSSYVGQLADGIYEIEAALPSYKAARQQIVVNIGEPKGYELIPTPIYGWVSLSSTPMEAKIYIDGQYCGETPDIVRDRLIGEHTLRLTKSRYKDHTETFTVNENAETKLEVTLVDDYKELGDDYYYGRNGVQRDTAEAFRLYKKGAEEQGDLKLQENLGDYYYNGWHGVQKDIDEAMKWYKMAAAQGDRDSQFRVGWYYDEESNPVNHQEALKWYKMAADQGFALAQNNIGAMYANGNLGSADYNEAAKWYRMAAEKGDDYAQNNLGNIYYYGRGDFAVDYEEAAKWFRKAAEQGHIYGLYNLGRMYENGQGVQKDIDEAVKWYRKAAAKGHSDAKKALERLGVPEKENE